MTADAERGAEIAGTSPMAKSYTVTGRALSATSSPSRTRLYARRPSTLIALTWGGICSIGPVRSAIAARRSSSVTPAAGEVAVTSPSASSVLVDWPSRMTAS
jgi:hypothetical protein